MQAFGGLAGLGYGGSGYGAPAAPAPVTPVPTGGGFGAGTGTATGAPDYAGYIMNNRGLRTAYENLNTRDRDYVLRSYDANRDGQLSADEYGRFHWEQAGSRENWPITPFKPAPPPPPPGPPPPPPAPRTPEDVAPLETDLAAFGVNTSPEQPFVDLAGADLRTQQLLDLAPNSTVSDYQEAEALTDLGASELFDLLDQRLGGVTSSEVIDPRMAAEFGGAINARDYALDQVGAANIEDYAQARALGGALNARDYAIDQVGAPNAEAYVQERALGGASNARDYAQGQALAFADNPYYRLMFDEGLDALNESVSSRGLRDSGYGVKAAMDYGQGQLARGYADEYGRAYGAYYDKADRDERAFADEYNRAYSGYSDNDERSRQNYLTDYGLAYSGYSDRLADLYGRYFDDRGFLTGRYDDTMNRAAAEYGDIYNQFPTARGTEFDRNMRMLDVGRGATQSVANAGSQYGTNVSNLALANAQAQGSAGIAQASIWGDAIGSVGQTIAGLPWGDWFGKQTQNPTGPANQSEWGLF